MPAVPAGCWSRAPCPSRSLVEPEPTPKLQPAARRAFIPRPKRLPPNFLSPTSPRSLHQPTPAIGRGHGEGWARRRRRRPRHRPLQLVRRTRRSTSTRSSPTPRGRRRGRSPLREPAARLLTRSRGGGLVDQLGRPVSSSSTRRGRRSPTPDDVGPGPHRRCSSGVGRTRSRTALSLGGASGMAPVAVLGGHPNPAISGQLKTGHFR